MSVLLKNLFKTFKTERGEVKALRDVNLEIKTGEFFSLLGPSGCGKTTTIRSLAGLENPDEGEICLGGELVFSRAKNKMVPTYQRKIGMVFQSYAIWPHMNVFNNIAFPLKYVPEKLSKRQIRERVTRVCALVHLEGFESRPATQLSGGQQQRVALARSLIRNPEVILLDEPLSNLDAKLRTETRSELRKLLKGLGTTVVYVTHDQQEAFAVSDRIGIMLDGRLVQVGTPREIYLQPRETFIADFVGSSNFLDGEVTEDKVQPEKKIVNTDIGIIECPGLANLPLDQKVRLSIRAESIKIINPLAAAANCFSGTVQSATFLGECTDCEIEIQNRSFQAKIPPEIEISAGRQVCVLFPIESLVLIM